MAELLIFPLSGFSLGVRQYVASDVMAGQTTLARFTPAPHWVVLPLAIVAGAWTWSVVAAQGLGLRAEQLKPGQMRIKWKRSRPVMAARTGVLEIRDGSRVLVYPLNADRLRNSSLTYLRQTARVTVRMRLNTDERSAPLEETISIAGPPIPSPPRNPAEVAQASASVNIPGAPPPPEKPILVADVSPPLTQPKAAPEVLPPVVTETPDANRVAAHRPLQLPPPVSRPVAPTVDALPAPPAVVSTLAPAPILNALNLPAPKPTIGLQPRSGRLIWTGSLERRGVVEIEGNRSTVGSLSGELPGVKASFRVSPAEFVAGGLVVYTTDRVADHRSEAAAANNGWNATRFQWDAERARQLVVLEAPNPSNDFKRLALRSDARNCSVIIVDWSVP